MRWIFDFFNKIEVYTSIDDMPVYNWLKFQETNDYSYVLVKKVKVNDNKLHILVDAIDRLRDQFIDVYGISDSYRAILRKQMNIAKMRFKLASTGDKSYITFINLETDELKKLTTPIDSISKIISSQKRAIQKANGFRLDTKAISVREYYDELEALKTNGEK